MNDRSTFRFRHAVAVIAGFAAASVALSGCLYAMIPEDTAPRPSATNAPDTEGVSAELLSFYGQTLSWTSCGSGFDCTDVTAPLDWENLGAGEITLAVVRHRAQGTPMGSLLTNPGGPGASGVDLVLNYLDNAVGAPLIESYDVIGFDPRGVGVSTAVTCYDTAEMDDYLYGIPAAARGTAEWEAEVTEENRRFAEACDANSGGILPFIMTVNVARDMDLIRAALGDRQLNYIGYSYGTFLGATYASLYPERVGRLVLDGAIDPAVSGFEVGATQAVGFESALRVYMQNCLGSGRCPLNGTVDDAMADLGALLASVDAAPMRNGDGRLMGANSLMIGIVAALYSQDSWIYLTQALEQALQGNPSTAFLLADFYNSREGGRYITNSTEAFSTYNCMDYPANENPLAEAEARAAAEAEIAQGAPTIAPYWSGPNGCEVWPYPPVGLRGEITAEGSRPILVIGTTNDPATPYAWSVSLAEQLQEGVLITRVGEGHTGYGQGSLCVDEAVETFFLKGLVPQNGLRCE